MSPGGAVTDQLLLIWTTERTSVVRTTVFTSVYYNDGNSLPFFPIPISWGLFWVWIPQERYASFLLLGANGAIDNILAEMADVHLIRSMPVFSFPRGWNWNIAGSTLPTW